MGVASVRRTIIEDQSDGAVLLPSHAQEPYFDFNLKHNLSISVQIPASRNLPIHDSSKNMITQSLDICCIKAVHSSHSLSN
jgi:hypothetical protein